MLSTVIKLLQLLFDTRYGLAVGTYQSSFDKSVLRATFKVRSPYQSSVCGLCGDYNGNPNNDFTIGESCPHLYPVGQQVSDSRFPVGFFVL